MLKSARYLILGIISGILVITPTPVLAKGKEVVIPTFHPHAIYWTALGLGILTILCVVFSPHREDDDYN
jgi:energy-converting hydrogenase Eha subunit A